MFDMSGTAWEECRRDASLRSQPNPCHQDGEGDGGNCVIPGEDFLSSKPSLASGSLFTFTELSLL